MTVEGKMDVYGIDPAIVMSDEGPIAQLSLTENSRNGVPEDPAADPSRFEIDRLMDDGWGMTPNAKSIGRQVLNGVIGFDKATASSRAVTDEGPNQAPNGGNLNSPTQH